MLLNGMVENRFWIGLRGVLAVIFGIIALVWPSITIITLIYVFAAYALIDGILTIIWSFRFRETRERWWLGLIEGIVDIIAGVIAFIFPTLAAVTLLFVIAAWAVITGIFEIVTAIRMRRVIDNEWSMGLAGLASIILGIVIFLSPASGMLGLVWVIGLWAIVFGILLIVLAFRLGKVAKDKNVESGGAKTFTP